MTWAETSDGYVNLATATKIGRNIQGNWLAYDANRESHLLIEVGTDFTGDTREAIIPTTGSQILCVIYCRDTEKLDIGTFRLPILAWHVVGKYAGPIVPGCEHLFDGPTRMGLIELPNGNFLEARYEGAIFQSLDEAKEQLIQEIKDFAQHRVRVTEPSGYIVSSYPKRE